jgi:hypothetical protein
MSERKRASVEKLMPFSPLGGVVCIQADEPLSDRNDVESVATPKPAENDRIATNTSVERITLSSNLLMKISEQSGFPY